MNDSFGVARLNLINCPNCNTLPSYHKNVVQYDWLIELQCLNCNISWSICTKCSGLRKRLFQQKYITQHHKQYHENLKKRKIDELESNDDDYENNVGYSFENFEPSTINSQNQMTTEQFYDNLRYSAEDTTSFDHFNGDNNCFFFNHLHKENIKHALISKCLNMENSTNFSLSDVEANLHMNLCKLSFILTRNTRNILIDVIKGITQYTIEQIIEQIKNEKKFNKTNTK